MARARLTNLLSRPRAIATRASRFHAWLLRRTRGRLVGRNLLVPRQRVLALTTTGRKSGRRRSTALGYVESEGKIVVVASNAGMDRPPAWWLNVQEKPEAEIDLQGERRAVRARVATSDERAELWPLVLEQFQGFEDYDRYTQRELPLVVLEPREG